jgi:prepilin-type processing-associated H-X9-DG protein
MAIAAQMYLETWEGVLPTSTVYPNPPNMNNYGFGFWMGLLQPYLKTYNVFRCPSAPHDKPVWLPDNSPYPVANYGYNEYIVFSVDRDFATEANLKNPTLTALMADCFNAALFHDWGEAEDPNTDWKNAPDKKHLPSGMLRIKYANGLNGGKVLSSRHEGTNIVYCDAHAAFMPVTRFEDMTKSGKRYQRPIINPDALPVP